MATFLTDREQEEKIWPHVAERSQDNAAIQAVRTQAERGEVTADEVADGEFGELLTQG